MKIRPAGVSNDGTRNYELTGWPGAPKDIPGIKKRTGVLTMTGSGAPLIHQRPPRLGEAVTVETDAGGIRLRVKKIRDDSAMIGTVEILNTPSGTALDINGIRHQDSVIVRAMDFVQVVHTD